MANLLAGELAAGCFATVTLLAYSLGKLHMEKKAKALRRIRLLTEHAPEEGREETGKSKGGGHRASVFLAACLRPLRRLFRVRRPGAGPSRLEIALTQAGNPYQMGPFEYRLLQVLLYAALPALFVLYGVLLRLSLGPLFLLGLAGIAAAAAVPPGLLRGRIRRRCRTALRELPDVLDLLTVSLEAGLGFDAALGKLIAKKVGVLSGEFHRCLEEIRLGKTRREALTGVRERLPLDEIKVLVGSILQAEKLGIGMVQVLRVQSAEVRDRRRQRAEEAAMKAPIKMLFPLVFFIFPSLFVILLGPVVISFLSTFGK